SVLIDDDRLCWNRCLRKVALELYENISKTPVGCGDHRFLEDALAGVHLGALGIHPHSNYRIARQLAHQSDVALDGPSGALGQSGCGTGSQADEQDEKNSILQLPLFSLTGGGSFSSGYQ